MQTVATTADRWAYVMGPHGEPVSMGSPVTHGGDMVDPLYSLAGDFPKRYLPARVPLP